MIATSLEVITKYVQGQLIALQNAEVIIDNVVTDSRKMTSEGNNLFVALRGERFDGHQFIDTVVRQGAKAVLVDTVTPNCPVPQIVVQNTTEALGLLGKLNREQSKAQVVCITGTCGKTSVKEMTASIVSLLGKTLATVGNFNNAIGVPQTLLNLSTDTEYAVIELGASAPGELQYTVGLAEPKAVLINNVGGAHLQGFGSLLGVYHAKSEVLDYMFAHDGVGIVNADNQFYPNWQHDYQQHQLLSFSGQGNTQATTYAEQIILNAQGCASFTLVCPLGKTTITLQVPGRHNVANALAATTLSIQLGATLDHIKQGLESVRPVAGRLCFMHFGALTLIDDAYNASVDAVKASISTLSLMPGPKAFIFGDMGELGTNAQQLHREIGQFAKGKIDYLLTFGPLAALTATEFGGEAFQDKEALCQAVQALITKNSNLYIAVKGSHAMHMNEVVDFIKKDRATQC